MPMLLLTAAGSGELDQIGDLHHLAKNELIITPAAGLATRETKGKSLTE
jgi:hypothetical protein